MCAPRGWRGLLEDGAMAKGQMRSNKEKKKPKADKKNKNKAPAPSPFAKGGSASGSNPQGKKS